LRELVPLLTKIAVLRNPANRAEEVAIRATQTVAQKLGMSVTVVTLNEPGEFDNAIAALAQNGIQSIIVPPDPMFNEHRSKLVQLIAQSRIPAIYMETGFVAEGGLIDECAAAHSMTSSARPSSEPGIVSPRDFASFKLTNSWNLDSR